MIRVVESFRRAVPVVLGLVGGRFGHPGDVEGMAGFTAPAPDRGLAEAAGDDGSPVEKPAMGAPGGDGVHGAIVATRMAGRCARRRCPYFTDFRHSCESVGNAPAKSDMLGQRRR